MRNLYRNIILSFDFYVPRLLNLMILPVHFGMERKIDFEIFLSSKHFSWGESDCCILLRYQLISFYFENLQKGTLFGLIIARTGDETTKISYFSQSFGWKVLERWKVFWFVSRVLWCLVHQKHLTKSYWNMKLVLRLFMYQPFCDIYFQWFSSWLSFSACLTTHICRYC